MIAFKIIPLDLAPEEKESVDKAIEIFNGSQNEFKLDCCDPINSLEVGSIDWPASKNLLSKTFSQSRVIAVTSKQFSDGWFSHTEEKVSVISTSDWKCFFSPPGLHCYLLLEFGLSMYFHASNVNEMETDPHYETEGCLLDMCDYKTDCKWKVKVGYICEKHSANFRRFGGSEEQLEAIQTVLDEVRRVSLGRPPLHNESTNTYIPTTEFTIESIKKHPVVVAAILLTIGAGMGWGIAWKLWIDPKNDKITTLEKQITGDLVRKSESSYPITDPNIQEMVVKRLSKEKLINKKRIVTCSIKEINKDVITYDLINEFEVKNTNYKAVTEELEIRQNMNYNVFVTVDNIVINPSKVNSSSPNESICTYSITLQPGDIKTVIYTASNIKERLPFERADTLTRPTLYSAFFVEGPKALMEQISVDTIGLTWRDNWEMYSPTHPDKSIIGWRSRSSMFPYQGAYLMIKKK